MSTHTTSLILLFSMGAAMAAPATAQTSPTLDGGWPKVYSRGDDSIAIYQPQINSWSGNALRARAAVGVKPAGSKESVFGIIGLEARTDVDKDDRQVDLSDLVITSSSFPSAAAGDSAYVQLVRSVLPQGPLTISLDRLEQSLGITHAEQLGGAQPLENTPPAIIISPVMALLVTVSGPPAFVSIPNTKLDRVLNTQVFLVRDKHGHYYLHVFDGFMTTKTLDSNWVVAKKVPGDVEQAGATAAQDKKADMLVGPAVSDSTPAPSLKTTVPKIFIATGPAELIVTDGAPDYEPIPGTELLYVSNTSGNIFRDMANDQMYVLVTGRWFEASSASGPWTFVPAGQLPPDFARIPDDSPKENVKASIPGTVQAKEAVIENQIPQTAMVNLGTVKLDPAPTYDGGTPQLQAIASTPLQYAVNTPIPVIWVNSMSWYALQNGVWFTAASAYGPWTAATSVPASIYSIPPSSSLYYVTFARIYGSTSTVVYVGYTAGYLGAVVTPDGTVVYGTGYVYSPYINGTVYYPVPTTYGYAANPTWTPYAGWAIAFGVGWWVGTASAGWGYGWGYGCAPYWGAYGYGYHPAGFAYGAYGGAAAWGPGGWAATTGNVYSRYGSTQAVTRTSGGYNAWTGNAWNSKVGTAYNSRTGTLAAGQRASVTNVYTGQTASGSRGVAYNPNTGKATSWGAVGSDGSGIGHVGNNVYADNDGNLYRSSDGGWQQAGSGGGWSGMGSNQAGAANLNNWSNDRSMGDQRSDSANQFGSAGGWGGGRGMGGGWSGGGWGGGGGRFGGGGGFRR